MSVQRFRSPRKTRKRSTHSGHRKSRRQPRSKRVVWEDPKLLNTEILSPNARKPKTPQHPKRRRPFEAFETNLGVSENWGTFFIVVPPIRTMAFWGIQGVLGMPMSTLFRNFCASQCHSTVLNPKPYMLQVPRILGACALGLKGWLG